MRKTKIFALEELQVLGKGSGGKDTSKDKKQNRISCIYENDSRDQNKEYVLDRPGAACPAPSR